MSVPRLTKSATLSRSMRAWSLPEADVCESAAKSLLRGWMKLVNRRFPPPTGGVFEYGF
jgi:hypothetical protein